MCSLFTAWLAAAFPDVKVTGRNGCVPATPSGFMELCLDKHLGSDADLVFIEYATNDGPDVANVVGRSTHERLMRKVRSVLHVVCTVPGVVGDTRRSRKGHTAAHDHTPLAPCRF